MNICVQTILGLKRWKTTSIFPKMEDDLKFWKIEDDLKKFKMEDDLKNFKSRRQPQF
jgi:hypothetical protein